MTEPADGDSGQPSEIPSSSTPGEPTAPEPGEAVPGQKRSLAAAFDDHRTLFVLGGIGTLVLVTVLAIVVTVLISNARSTASIRVITPAPATAGGLHRDYTDEAGPQFRAIVSEFRKQFTSPGIKTIAAAIYSNATGSTLAGASVGVFYLGINASRSIDPANAFNSFGSFLSTAQFPTRLDVSGMPGDAKAECFGRTVSGRAISWCLMDTDNTATFLVSLVPATVNELASLLQKMRPDLQRG